MKKVLLFLTATIIAVSCSVNDLPVEGVIEGESFTSIVFTFPEIEYIADEIETRAGVQRTSTATGFVWEATDTVGIFPDKGSQIYWSMAGGAGTNTVSFDGGAWSLKPGSSFYCYYPFVPDIYLKKDHVPVSFLGQVQKGYDSFGGAKFVLVADGMSNDQGGLNFDFTCLNTIINVNATLPAGTYTKITITAPEALFVSDGFYSLDSKSITGKTFSKTLSIDLEDVTLDGITTIPVYLMSAPVNLKDKQVIVSAYRADGAVLTCEKTPSKVYEAQTRYGLTCDFTTPEDRYISFSDSAVKAICVANWDTDGDGELSYDEAAAVKTIPYDVFSGNTQITSFDEFQYFTGVTTLGYDVDNDEGADYFGAFSGCTNLKSITLPPTLKTISWGCFRGCSSLEELIVPKSVTKIQQVAFLGCSSLELHMESETPCSLQGDGTYIGGDPCAFGFLYNIDVKAIYVPDEDAATAYKAAQFWPASRIHPEGWVDPSDIITFQDALTELYCVDNWDTNGDGKLSKGEAAAVTDIGTILQGTDIVYFEELKYFSNLSSLSDEAFKNCKYLQSISFPLNIQTIGPSLFSGCVKLNKICVPSLRMWMDIISPVKPFTSIPGDLYIGDNLVTRMIIPEGTTRVNDYLCYNLSKLNSVSIPSTVTSIGSYSFYRCTGLTSVNIPQSVTAIGEYAFYGCSGISSISFPDGISSIGNSSFYSCSGLTSLTLPESATSIGTYAFSYCTSIESANLPEGLTTIPDGLFSGCSSLSQVYPDTFSVIGNSSFSGCAIESITVSQMIGQYSFSNCKSLSNITLEEGLYRIRRSAFSGCTSLKEITLPKSLAGSYSLCENINTYSGSGEYNTYGAFYGSSIEKITCYDSLLERYDLPLGDRGTYSRLVSAFYYVTEPSYKWIYNDTAETVKEITIIKTSTVYSIPARAFSSFDGLETINLPSGLTSVGMNSFSGCSSLRDFVFQPTLKGIGQYAFSGCAFTSVNLPAGLSSIDMGAFSNCQYLESVTIPNSVGTIADYTFSNCSSLTSIVIPESVTSIGYNAFEYCSALTSITVPIGITSIGKYAFSGCKNLSSIFVKPVTPPAGGSNMFYNTNNCPIYVPLGTVDTYKSANIWSSYENRIQVDPSQVVHVSGVSLNASSLSLAAGATSTLIPALTPSNATDKSVTWSSSDQSVATVDAQGVVTAVSAGTATITVTTSDGGHMAACEVTVRDPFPEGTSFDPDAYITYVSNHQEWGNLSTEKDYMYDTQFSADVSGTRIEMKFQISDYSSGEAILSQGPNLGNGLAIDASNVYQVRFVGKHEDGDTWYNQAFDSGVGNGIDGTGVVVLTASCDGNQIVASVNGNETTIPVSVSSWSFNYLFSYFDYEGGDGSKYEYLAGVPDGAKLYYVKIWNGDDLVYFGHASRSVCSFSSEEEYCWYEEVGNKYTFARNLHTLASSEIIPYQTISPVVSVRQPFGGGID